MHCASFCHGVFENIYVWVKTDGKPQRCWLHQELLSGAIPPAENGKSSQDPDLSHGFPLF